MNAHRGILIGGLAMSLLPVAALATNPSFVSVAPQAGIAVSYNPGSFPNDSYGGSACIGDFDRDGWQDIYVCSGADGGPDHLFMNDHDGTFTDKAAEWGCNVVHDGKGITVGDYDNDGWLDVYVVSAPISGCKLWHNNGGKSFTNVAAQAGITFSSPSQETTWFGCFGDYDLDGDLDLFTAGHTSPPHTGSRLFRNNGDGTFTDVTTAANIWKLPNGSTTGSIAAFAGSFTDMDGDRYPELLVTADFKCSGSTGGRYWRNNKDGTFSDVTDNAGLGLEGNGMGQTRGDFNNDGLCDWYTSTIYGFTCSAPIGFDHNRLYLNQGDHHYHDSGTPAGVGDGGYGWGSVAVDFDHDGWLDIGETNGPTQTVHARLFMNDKDGTFTEKSTQFGLNHTGYGKTMAAFDYDNDGDQDVLIHSRNVPLALYRNDLNHDASDAHWVRIFLDTSSRSDLAPDGYGSKITVTANGLTMTRWMDGGNSFLGISELSAHFGLGEDDTIDEVRVLWNDGSETVMTDVPANQVLTISPAPPPPACPTDLDGSGGTDSGDLNLLLGGFGSSALGDIDGDGDTDSADLNLLLAVFGQDCI